ncbi:villin-2-like [Dioscorea cayenensis subsp. rotundata]|uniref:Villin-2-like n=1 Tax=Dioscorea cayennensis subsp. rotundata TaxID=55577 RepID=A0AB40BKS2_DIOCR|nr:villin-2-like [Dioscorea cayenensis subsp. rotundata]
MSLVKPDLCQRDYDATQDSQAVEFGEGNTFSYESLKSKSSNPVTGINYKRREIYLSDEEFQTVFGMTKELFYQQPKWKQDLQKKNADLF